MINIHCPKKYFSPLTVAGFLLTTTFPAFGQESLITIVQELMPTIVTIEAQNTKKFKSPGVSLARDPKTGRVVAARNLTAAAYQRTGAGVIIASSGLIVTNAHVVQNADRIQIRLNDQTVVTARPVWMVNNYDVAFLKIDAGYSLPKVSLANSDELKLRDEIVTVGNSPLLKETISGGRIIGLGVDHQNRETGEQRTDLIQISINLYKGDSGGPLFNREGQLVGLMVAGQIKADHSSFAIPVNKIKGYYQDYLLSLKPKF